MIAMTLVATMMVVGLTIGCVAADIHFDEQERRLKEEHYLERRFRDWYAQRDAGRRGRARSGQSGRRAPRPRWQVAGLYRFR